MLGEASAIRARLGGTPPWDLNDVLLARAKLLVVTGQADEGAQTLQESSVKPDTVGRITYGWLDVSLARAEIALAQKRPEAAIEQGGRVRRSIEESGLAPYFKRWEARAALDEGKGLLQTQRAPEALPRLQRAVQLGWEVYDLNRSLILADSQIALASCLLELGRRDQLHALLAQAKAIQSTYKDLSEQYKKPLRELELRLARRK
jgi:tetratricopeptide (TPR) repeat protein